MSYISDIHNSLYIISYIAECLLKYILHYIASQISYMRIVVYCRPACVHLNLSFLIRNKKLHISCQSVKKTNSVFHCNLFLHMFYQPCDCIFQLLYIIHDRVRQMYLIKVSARYPYVIALYNTSRNSHHCRIRRHIV